MLDLAVVFGDMRIKLTRKENNMFELGLRNAKLLKKFLSVKYYEYEISNCQDICTLTKMCGISLIFWWFWLFVGAMTLGILCVLLTSFSLITLYLPEGYQAPMIMLELGFAAIVAMIATGCMVTIAAALQVSEGNMQFAPEYMKRPLRKLFKKNVSLQDDALPKEKEPSQTWTAIKEMCKSFKDKTCIKVKM